MKTIDFCKSRRYNYKLNHEEKRMKEEKIDRLAKLIFSMMPVMRRDSIAPARGSENKLAPHAVFCLFILHKLKKTSMSSLAERLGVSNPQLTRIVNGLVQQGFASRETDAANRRQVFVNISPQGEREALKFIEIGRRHVASHFESLTEDEIDACIYHLSELLKILQKTGNI